METRALEAREAQLRRLMIAGLAGDADAHRELLTAVSSGLRAYFRRRLARIGRGQVDAEDLVQDVLLAVHTRRHTYDSAQLFTPWMYAIARYKFVDYLRRTKTAVQDVDLGDAEELLAHDDIASIESTLDLEQLLTRLTPQARRAIRSVKLEGLKVSEAAARLGRSPSAVKVSVHRGLKRLARLMGRGPHQ